MTINKGIDFLERVGWTALQAGAASLLVLGLNYDSLKVAGAAAAAAALKVIVAQNVGKSDLGALPDPSGK